MNILISRNTIGSLRFFSIHRDSFSAKRTPGKSKEEMNLEKKQELEKRLENVKGALSGGQPKKTPKKGETDCSLVQL